MKKYLISSLLSLICYSTSPFADSGTCGSEEWQKAIIPDSFFGARFAPYCAKHDACYDTCGKNKNACDNEFKSGMRQECKDTYVRLEHKIQRELCLKDADLYHSAVNRLGGDAYRDAQNNCVPPPPSTLSQLNGACNSPHVSQSRACLDAVGKYCRDTHNAQAGLPQEVGGDGFIAVCIKPAWDGHILEKGLSDQHSGCNDIEKSRTPACTAAAKRYCDNRGYSAGFVQRSSEWFENPDDVTEGPTYFAFYHVMCFAGAISVHLNLTEMKRYHDGCNNSEPQSAFCTVAAHRYCHQVYGTELGLVQEAAGENFVIACIPDETWVGFLKL